MHEMDLGVSPIAQESEKLPQSLTKGEQRASWILPIARMLRYDVLSLFEDQPLRLMGVFIGPWTRGFVEANAFRIACVERGIEPQTVFLIDINDQAIDRSIEKTEREQIHNALSTSEGGEPFLNTGAIKLGDDDFNTYTSRDFISVVDSNKEIKLPPLVFIKGDAGNAQLAEAIVRTNHDSSLLGIGRNVDPTPFSYRQIVETWARQVNFKNRLGRMSFLSFTATDQILAEKMYGYIHEGLDRHQSTHNGTHSDLLRIFTPKEGLLLTFRPNLESLGAHFSDNYIHIIGGLPLND